MQEGEILELLFRQDEKGLELVASEYDELLCSIASGVL